MIDMRIDHYYESCGIGYIRAGIWAPKKEVTCIVQIVHGIAEHIERYDSFARYLNQHGVLVVAADHMGHGKSIGSDGTRGYFHGGWFSAVKDAYQLLADTRAQYPHVPYVLFGHSMGSFIARSILAMYPESGIHAAIICGTAWQSDALLAAAIPMSRFFCKREGEMNPSPAMQKVMFGSYNKRIEHIRTENDWLTRDYKIVDAYNNDPLCGFTATAGLYRDMLEGIRYIQRNDTLAAMNKELPVLFVAGGDDPVGSFGKGVRQAADAFSRSGMKNIECKIYPLCRHEILNEINNEEIYNDILGYIQRMTQ